MNDELERPAPESDEETHSVAELEIRRLDVAFWPLMLGALSIQFAAALYVFVQDDGGGIVFEFALSVMMFTIVLATPLAYAMAMLAAWRSQGATHVVSPMILAWIVGMLFPSCSVILTYMMVVYSLSMDFYPAVMTFVTATIVVSFAFVELLTMSCARTDKSNAGYSARSRKRSRRRSPGEWFQRHFSFSFGGLMACFTFVAVSLALLWQSPSRLSVIWLGLLPLVGNGTMYFIARKQRYLMLGSVLVCVLIPWFTAVILFVSIVRDFASAMT